MSGYDAVVNKAKQPWWGRTHPSHYLCKHPETGHMVGVGLLAARDYATFNLWYLSSDQPSAAGMVFQEASKDINVWVLAKEFGQVLHQGYPLSEWAMVLPLHQFDALTRQGQFSLSYQGRWYVLASDLRRQFDVIAPAITAPPRTGKYREKREQLPEPGRAGDQSR